MLFDKIVSRSALVFSKRDMERIKHSRIALAGIGGLGCIVAEILVRTGIGRLSIMDNGVVDMPDLGRQSLYDVDDIGKKKIDAAKEKLMKKTQTCKIDVFDYDIKNDNLEGITSDVDGIADCLDNYESRFALEEYLNKNQFLVHGGVEQTYGQITTIIKNQTQSLRMLYGGLGENKGVIGVSTPAVFVIASLMSQEIINNILDKPQLVNKMLIVELDDFSFNIMDLG